MSDYFGKDVFKLGFGLMRLPKLSDGKSIDVEQTSKMVDMFLEAGGTYFDTPPMSMMMADRRKL